MSRRHWRQRVADIIAAIREIQDLAGDRAPVAIEADSATYKAILYNFVIIGEAARHVPEDIGKLTPEIDWGGMRAMRNVVTHVYFGVDAARVHQTIMNDLPVTLAALVRLQSLPDPPPPSLGD